MPAGNRPNDPRAPERRESLEIPAGGRGRLGSVASAAALGLALLLAAPPRTTAQEAPAPASLDERLREVLEAPGFENAHWGILVVDAKTGETVFERNPDQLCGTASVAKLFSTAAAWVELGPDYRFQTPVARRGEVDDKGTLKGDLVLIAKGDMAMGGRTGPDGQLLFKDVDHIYGGTELVSADPLAGLEHLAREVRASGIQRITGEVIVDDRLFEAAPSSGSGPERVSPIMINDNMIDIVIQGAEKPGEPASVTLSPASGYATMDAKVETVAPDAKAQVWARRAGPRRFTVRGRVPAGKPAVLETQVVDDPASFARTLLIEALGRHGVSVEASPLTENPGDSLPPRAEVEKLPKVAEYTSPPFREYVRVCLKVSHNPYATTLPLLLAAHKGDRSLFSGLKRQGEILKELGLDPLAVSFGGGAGGTWADMATPRATVALLRAMAARPDFSAYDAALPILGRDGTLAGVVDKESPARGHAHAKTGTYFVANRLTGQRLLTSKSLAGYLETASGRQLVLAAFLNNVILDPNPETNKRQFPPTTTGAGKLLGRLCEILHADAPPAQEPEK